MKPILSTEYSIFFKEDAYQRLNNYLTENKTSKVFILVDENTREFCLPTLRKKLNDNIIFEIIEIKEGEVHKNIKTCVEVWKTLTKFEADRKSILINLGGGMVSDLGGFVASTYKRGIRFINIPTTLLSMVDASVGSKTGVDLDNLKNLVGLFSDPEMVLIDTSYLNTLKEREMRSGIAEVIKYGLTFDDNLLVKVKKYKWKVNNDLNDIIYRSIIIKNDVVLKDFKEKNLRKVLNFGHTAGHAIESYFLNHSTLPSLTHGEAIAIGMVIEAYISHKIYNFPIDELESLKSYIQKTFGRILIPQENYDDILKLMKHDKKNSDGNINYILLKNVADFVIDGRAPLSLVIDGFNYYNS
jgi:3-dehydroquinate synthase